MASSASHNAQLDGIRGVAVLTVLYAHLQAPESELGHVGVRAFFLLSGFLITGILLKAQEAPGFRLGDTLRAFFVHRALRIMPAYYAMLLAVYVADAGGVRNSISWHLAFMSNIWFAERGDWVPWTLSPAWTLAVEVQFYMIWPFVVLALGRSRLAIACYAVLALTIAGRIYWLLVPEDLSGHGLWLMGSIDALTLGSLLALRRNWESWRSSRALTAGALVCIAATTVLLVIKLREPTLAALAYNGIELLPMLPIALLVILASNHGLGWTATILATWPLSSLGRISYGVYLYHLPVLVTVLYLAGSHFSVVTRPGLVRFLVVGAMAIGVGALSWRFLERPIQRLKRHFPLGGSLSAPGRSVA